MARPLRIEFEGALYHVTSRGNAGQSIFRNDADRVCFLDVLGRAIAQSGWICHAYCLMSNHYHLLLETPRPNLSHGMRYLNGVYTQSVNRRYHRSGHIFQGRFKAILVEKESHLLQVARYIVLNPVRAKMVKDPGDWPWSSYSATVGDTVCPSFLRTAWLLGSFDAGRDDARIRYRDFVRNGGGVSLWEGVRSGALLGGDTFVEQMRPLLRDAVRSKEIPREERHLAHPSIAELLEGTEGDKELRNRQIYKAVREYDYTLFQLQDALGLHYSTISRIVKRVDELERSKNKT